MIEGCFFFYGIGQMVLNRENVKGFAETFVHIYMYKYVLAG